MDNQNIDPGSWQEQNKRERRTLQKVKIVIFVAGLSLIGYLLRTPANQVDVPETVSSQSQLESQPDVQSEPESESASEPEAFFYPVGKLCVSGFREAYVSGDMVLEIPRLELVSPVIAGSDDASLKKGVGLFDYAQLPGPYNSNTSLVAHRDIFGMEFYYIDTITDGDLMYLTYQGKKYTYEYIETFITNDSDWDPIRVKDFACITLQSCDPIGTSLKRIFVVGKLIDTQDVE